MVRPLTKNERPGSVNRHQQLKRLFGVSAGVLGALCGTILSAASADYAQPTRLPSPAAAGKPPLESEKKEVGIDNFSFAPGVLNITVNTQVTWVNHDDMPHTLVGTKKQFRSPVLDTDDQFFYTFAKRGTYLYYCSVHPQMTGKIVVR